MKWFYVAFQYHFHLSEMPINVLQSKAKSHSILNISHSSAVTVQQKSPHGKRVIFKSLSAKYLFGRAERPIQALLKLSVLNGRERLYVLFLFKLNIYWVRASCSL